MCTSPPDLRQISPHLPISPRQVDEFVYISDSTYTRAEILAMASTALTRPRHLPDTSTTLPRHFLGVHRPQPPPVRPLRRHAKGLLAAVRARGAAGETGLLCPRSSLLSAPLSRYVRAAQAACGVDETAASLCSYLCELTLPEYALLAFRPSEARRTHTHTCTHMHTCTRTRTRTHTRTHAHTHTHARAHAHTHTRTHWALPFGAVRLFSSDVQSRGTSPALAPPPRVCGEAHRCLTLGRRGGCPARAAHAPPPSLVRGAEMPRGGSHPWRDEPR